MRTGRKFRTCDRHLSEQPKWTHRTVSQCSRRIARLFVYENPISRHPVPPRFFMTFSPRSCAERKELEKSRWLTWTKVRGVAEGLFWHLACRGDHDRSADCYRRLRQKRDIEHGAVEHRDTGNQRLAEPVTKCRGFLSWSGPVENGAAHGDGERLYLFEQGRFSRHDLPARAADRLSGAVGVVSKLRAGSCVPA